MIVKLWGVELWYIIIHSFIYSFNKRQNCCVQGMFWRL